MQLKVSIYELIKQSPDDRLKRETLSSNLEPSSSVARVPRLGSKGEFSEGKLGVHTFLNARKRLFKDMFAIGGGGVRPLLPRPRYVTGAVRFYTPSLVHSPAYAV